MTNEITAMDTAAHAFAREVVGRLNSKLNLELHQILENESLSSQEVRNQLRDKIFEAAIRKVKPEDIGAQPLGGSASDDVELEPNISYPLARAKYIAGLRGQDLHDFLFSLTKRFEDIVNTTTPEDLGYQMFAGGITGIFAPAAWEAYKLYKAGGMTLLKAMVGGIRVFGMANLLTAAAGILAALLYFFFVQNNKTVFGLVFNDTDEEATVKNWKQSVNGGDGDLYVKHGSIVSYPEDFVFDPDSHRRVQISRRERMNEETFVFGGIFSGQKNTGLLGIEGLSLFTLGKDTGWVAHLFAVPYLRDNGTNIEYLTQRPTKLADLYEPLYATRQVVVNREQNGVRLMSAVEDARGGVIALVAMFSK